MLKFIKKWLRKRSLKTYSSPKATHFIPLKAIKSAIILLDAEDADREKSVKAITTFAQENNIELSIYYLDFRKINKKTPLLTDRKQTICLKDFNFYGRLNKELISKISSINSQLLLSLSLKQDFRIEFIIKIIQADFKIGRKFIDGKVLDIIVADKEDDICHSYDIFTKTTQLLSQIN